MNKPSLKLYVWIQYFYKCTYTRAL